MEPLDAPPVVEIAVMVAKYFDPDTAVVVTPVICSVCVRPNMSVPVTVKVIPLSEALVLTIDTRWALLKVALPLLVRLPFSVRLPPLLTVWAADNAALVPLFPSTSAELPA